MKNLFLVSASLSNKYAILIKFILLFFLAMLVEFLLRKDFVVCDVEVSGFTALLAIFSCFLPLDKTFYSATSRVLLVAYTAFCIVFTLYTDDLAVYALSGIVIISIAHRHSSPSLATMWIFPLIMFYLTYIFEIFVGFIDRVSNFNAKSPEVNVSKIFLYFIMPALLSLIFLSIFAGGYEEFAILKEHIFSLAWNIIDINFWYFIIVFLFLVALYKTKISSHFLITKDISFTLNEVWEKSFVICLFCFNLIFLSLNLINLKDLIFQDNQYNLARDAISACDAMVFASFLAGFCTLVFFLAKNQSKTLSMLLFAWLVQNLIIILTALIKLSTYIAEFTFTMSRLNGLFLICFLAISTALALWKMYSSMTIKALNNYIIYLALVLATVYICVDKENFITKYNLANTETPDFTYLQKLFPDSLPALYEYKERGNDVSINFKNYIEVNLKCSQPKTLKNKILRAKLVAIQEKLKQDTQ